MFFSPPQKSHCPNELSDMMTMTMISAISCCDMWCFHLKSYRQKGKCYHRPTTSTSSLYRMGKCERKAFFSSFFISFKRHGCEEDFFLQKPEENIRKFSQNSHSSTGMVALKAIFCLFLFRQLRIQTGFFSRVRYACMLYISKHFVVYFGNKTV